MHHVDEEKNRAQDTYDNLDVQDGFPQGHVILDVMDRLLFSARAVPIAARQVRVLAGVWPEVLGVVKVREHRRTVP